MIPKIIHHIWFNFENPGIKSKLPWKYRKQREVLMEMNPEYKFMFWTESNALPLIKEHYSKYYDLFINLKEPIEKVDIFKYMIMHHCGGIYLDVDIISRRPLRKFFRNKKMQYDVILSKENRYIMDKISLSNAVIMSSEGCDFWKDVIQYIFNWTPGYMSLLDNHIYILEKTGPIMLNKLYKANKNKYNFYVAADTCFMTDNIKGYLYHTSDKTWVDSRVYKSVLIMIILLILAIFIIYYCIRFIRRHMSKKKI